jgi:hypothetical protein
MRKLGLVVTAVILLVSCCGARAAVYSIDVTQQAGIPGTGGTTSLQPGCYCRPEPGFYSPVYEVSAGDTVNFGSIELGYYQSGETPDGGPNQLPLFIGGSYAISFNSSVLPSAYPDYSLGSPPLSNGATLLVYTVPDGADSVQLEFLGSYNYTPPTITDAVPEPSTWAMLLIGFASLGFAGWRRSRPVHT